MISPEVSQIQHIDPMRILDIEVVVLEKNKKSQRMLKSHRSSALSLSSSSENSSSLSRITSQSSFIEQKIYSTTSQQLASRNPQSPLKIRYNNVPQYAASSTHQSALLIGIPMRIWTLSRNIVPAKRGCRGCCCFRSLLSGSCWRERR
jgi:hypothetical protein